jgi:hypothetical protein
VTQLRTDNIQLRSENADIKSICAKTSEDVSIPTSNIKVTDKAWKQKLLEKVSP